MRFDPDLIRTLSRAQSVVALTGAGVSAESGVPTFREAQTGLWARFRPDELATPEAFQRNPKLVWDWYTWRRELVAKAEPNPGHHALVELEQLASAFTLVTQNVDGLHQRAGSRNVVELHGSLASTRCADDGGLVSAWEEGDQSPPHCPRCNGLLRPGVVWFNEALPEDALAAAVRAAEAADVVLAIGSSSLVHPAASLPVLARQSGALLVEINPSPTPLTPLAHHIFPAPSGHVLPALMAALRQA